MMCVQILTPKTVKWTAGKGDDINAENDVTRSGDELVDVCSDVNVENEVSRSGRVVVDMCNDVCNVNIENDVTG